MKEMVGGDASPTTEEVVVLMSNENHIPPSPQHHQVATLIPKHDIKKTRETSVYSHGDMTQRLSTTEIDETHISDSGGGGGGGGGTNTLQRIKDFKEQLDQMMSRRGCYASNLIALIIPLLLLIFGSAFLHKCSIQPYIPIYLIVAGVFSLLEILFRVFRNLGQKSKVLEAFMESQNNKPI